MESKSEKCKTEERQPDEVLRAREWLKTYERPLKHRTSWISTADVMNSISTSELSEMLAAFAQSIQAETLRAAKGSGHLRHADDCDYLGQVWGGELPCSCGFAEKFGDLL